MFCISFLNLLFERCIPCVGEGNGSPLQCSCLGNPVDRGAWGATVRGVAEKSDEAEWQSAYHMYHIISSNSCFLGGYCLYYNNFVSVL